MGGARRGQLRTGSLLVLALVAAATNVTAAALFSGAAPYVGFVDLARAAGPGLAFAAGAAAVSLLGGRALAVLPLAVASLAAAAPQLAVGLQQRSPVWVAVGAVGLLLAPAVVVAALAYPDGRVSSPIGRVAVAVVTLAGLAMAALGALSYDPAAWGWCECVANPLSLGPSEAWYSDVVSILAVGRILIVAVGLPAVLLTLEHRARIDIAFAGAFVALGCAWLSEDAWALVSTAFVPAAIAAMRDLSLVVLPVLYAVAYAGQRPSRSHVADLLLAARDEHHPARLRELVARAIGDPHTTVGWWDARSDGYLDERGQGVEVKGDAIRVEVVGRPIAVVLSDRLGKLEPEVRDSVAEALLLAAENRRLSVELQASIEQVRDSRARILTASDETRRRIERDLHDGAQQLLISTGIKLNLAAARVGGDDAEVARVIEEAAAELNRALAELRNLAAGIAPATLVHGSVENALQELALRSAVPTTVRVTGDGQPDEALSATVYFVVAEALANVAKHSEASSAVVELDLGDPLQVTVRDDGLGGATFDGRGSGLRGLVDRVEARGGVLSLDSGSAGTAVTAAIPHLTAVNLESLGP